MARQTHHFHLGGWFVWVVTIGLVVVMASGVSLFVVSLPQSVAGESVSVETPAPPRPTPVTTMPSTPSSTPPVPMSVEPVADPCDQWQFPQTRFSVPSVGIDGLLTEYSPADRAANGGEIVPPDKMSIVWDSYFCRVQNIPSYPSASAGDCIYIAGHSYSDNSAVFNNLAELPVGSQVILSNSNGETAWYQSVAMQDTDGIWKGELNILKENQQTDPRLYPDKLVPGCMKLVTCLSEGERDTSGHAIALRVITLQLVAVNHRKVTKQQFALEARLADRLK